MTRVISVANKRKTWGSPPNTCSQKLRHPESQVCIAVSDGRHAANAKMRCDGWLSKVCSCLYLLRFD